LSTDINLNGPTSGPDIADAGQANPVQIKIRRKAAASNCHFPGDEDVTVELWVANPSLMMAPHVRGSVSRVGFIGSPLPDEGGVGNQQIDWTPPSVSQPNDPQSAGPKCLVARCYPSSGLPNGTNFFVPFDQHTAQHNLCVVGANGQVVTLKLNTVNLSPQGFTLAQIPQLKLRAVLDLAPNNFVSKTIIRSLTSKTGFQHFRSSPLNGGFSFDLTGFQVFQVIDHSQPNSLHLSLQGTPSYEAHVQLPFNQLCQITFTADLTGVTAGEACVFHLTQTSITDVAEGGLTFVVLKH
jgi:hypothetical protein